jgi:hypothetical protein
LIISNFHHRLIVPLMERELRIFEMSDAANPTSLARSQLLQECLLEEYAATRARHAVNLKVVPLVVCDAPRCPAGEHNFSFPFGFFSHFYSS